MQNVTLLVYLRSGQFLATQVTNTTKDEVRKEFLQLLNHGGDAFEYNGDIFINSAIEGVKVK